MSDILIGQSFHLRFDEKNWEMKQPYPPLAPLYAASVLQENGYGVAFHDAMLARSTHEWAEKLDRHEPEIAVLYDDNFNFLTKMCLLRMREAAFTMMRMAKARNCTVVACSSDARDRKEQYLANGADYVLIGEGEPTLAELTDHLTGRGQKPLEEIEGLAYRAPEPNGAIHTTGPRPVIQDLDSLPFPAWDLVDMDRYRSVHYENHGFHSLNMVTSRGCTFGCSWCAKPIWGRHYNARSPENVVEEMQLLKDIYEPDHLWFMDDMLGIQPDWMSRFADEVEQKDVRIPFKCLNRVDLLLREGQVDALKRAGCQIVWSGVESGSQKVLDAMDKGITVEQTREATGRLKEAGIDVGFFLQFGYPGETREDINQTFQLVRDCRPDQIGVSVTYPLPGTTFYEEVRDQLDGKQNWTDSDDLALMYDGPFSSAFYEKLHRVMHHDFRMVKAWNRLTEVLDDPGSFERNHLRELLILLVYGFLRPVEWLHLELRARDAGRMLDRLKEAVPSPAKLFRSVEAT